MSRYNILWIDDEYEKLSSFILDAELDDIEITPFKTSRQGMKAFEDDMLKWDGIILDAKGWNKSSNEVATTEGMYNSLDKITELKHKRYVPVFVYSGQGDLFSDEQFKTSLRGHKIYKKGSSSDLKQLFIDIKSEADKLIETQIRFKYSNIVGIFSDINNELIGILSRVYNDITNDKDIFTSIRKILEWVMSYCNQQSVLPIKFCGSNLGECSKYLGKKEMQEFVPIHVQRSFHSCVEIANNGAHRLEIDSTVRNEKAPYLIRSTVFELLNILYWCKTLPTDNKSIERIKQKITELVSNDNLVIFEGIIQQDEQNNYHCGDYLLNYRDMQPEDIGRKIKIKKCSDNTQERSKHTYSHFAVRRHIELFD